MPNIPLTSLGGGLYSFTTIYNNESATGTILIKNANFGFTISAPGGGSYDDFATQNVVANTSISTGTYVTLCDQSNLSPCVITINNNQISINEYSPSGSATNLCTNQNLTAQPNSQNPNAFYFTCAISGGSMSGTWYATPFISNATSGFMLSEYNPNQNSSNLAGTNEIAFPQSTISPNGGFNYVYNSGSQAGISTTTFSINTIINSTIGTCSGAACALTLGAFYNYVMSGFGYFNVAGTANYNLVGNDNMAMYEDSYQGFYF
jgi:hypothetical protein